MPPQDPEPEDAPGSLVAPPVWLSYNDLVAVHAAAMSLMSERPRPVIDEGRLRSKLTRPVNAYHYEEVRDPFLLGAMVAVAISQAHGFEDGNKRTALASMAVFLGSLGFTVDVMDESVGQLAHRDRRGARPRPRRQDAGVRRVASTGDEPDIRSVTKVVLRIARHVGA